MIAASEASDLVSGKIARKQARREIHTQTHTCVEIFTAETNSAHIIY